ncbi:hypothetical protein [Bifidobacterium myosotis]|uniref:Uncharacterized protein n=1 Tax=Bifidobacterium myosotis TaxID=1630166 RepID=A0A5M9ZHK3_9BIFI|nr:hypothetical protein [Bifidobacterium myosotis]KAA8826988.1 hypothetical protein EMO91_10695 [Bifidobacterium myosotis]
MSRAVIMQVVPNTRHAIDDFLEETAEQENRETDGCGTTVKDLRRAIRWLGYPITDNYEEARRKVASDFRTASSRPACIGRTACPSRCANHANAWRTRIAC